MPLYLALLLCTANCGDSGNKNKVHFGLEIQDSGALDLRLMPFPNALLIDQQGELLVTASSLPFGDGANAEVIDAVSAAFQRQDCFGPGGGVIFPVLGLDEALDIAPGALNDLAHLVDLDTGEEIPSKAYYRSREQILHVRTQPGIALQPGGHYLTYLSGSFSLSDGSAVSASPTLSLLLGSSEPSASGLAHAYRAYEPLRNFASQSGLDTSTLLAATTHRTCTYEDGYQAIISEIASSAAPAITIDTVYQGGELDTFLGTPADNRAAGFGLADGVAHADLAAVVLGHFNAPNYLSSTPNTLGRFAYGTDGVAEAKGEQDVTFLLALPAGLADYSKVPVLIFQHGMGANRGRTLSLANRMAQEGMAVIGIDAPYHGHRLPNFSDEAHNYTGAPGPDGIADEAGAAPLALMFNLSGNEDVPGLDPEVMSDNFRQSVIDLVVLKRAITDGDWSGVASLDALFSGFSFRSDAIAFASESFGGLVGLPFVALSEEVGAAWLSVAGGGLSEDLLENSPTYAGLFMPLMAGTFGLRPNQLDPLNDPPHTHWSLQIFSMLMGAADPSSYVYSLQESSKHLVLSAAYYDEAMPNQSSQALAGQMELDWLDLAGGSESPEFLSPGFLSTTTAPVSGNQEAGNASVTRVYFEAEPATHPMLTVVTDERDFEYGFPPLVPLDEPVVVDNPVEELQAMLANFATSYFATGTAELINAFPAN
jgi:hypothetical protein